MLLHNPTCGIKQAVWAVTLCLASSFRDFASSAADIAFLRGSSARLHAASSDENHPFTLNLTSDQEFPEACGPIRRDVSPKHFLYDRRSEVSSKTSGKTDQCKMQKHQRQACLSSVD